MHAKKSLGQHFLMHKQTAERIADTAHLTPADTVLEIGPGTGMLTKQLLARAGKVIAVETDVDLATTLRETFAQKIKTGKFILLTQDVRSFDPASILEEYVLVANIPYYITGGIIRQFLQTPHKPRTITLLVQKEVAMRITREKKESVLSISIKVYGAPHYIFTVPRGAFLPAPSVDSAVISITDINNPFAHIDEEQWFFLILHAGFAHKRKLLARNLELLLPRNIIVHIFATLNIQLKERAEDISPSLWLSLAKETYNYSSAGSKL